MRTLKMTHSGLVDTINFGHDLGMDIWASRQICINGQTWRQFYTDYRTKSGPTIAVR